MDNLTAHLAAMLTAAKKKAAEAAKRKVINPQTVTAALPTSRVPKGTSLVSFPYLLKNSLKMHPDAANSADVKVIAIAKKEFKSGAKGIVTQTLTDLPQYKQPHKYQQVFRCPVDYKGKVCECPAIVANCSCPRFMFTWNWVLWAKHASVLNAINQAPDITNPAKLIAGCKHICKTMIAINRRKM